MFNEFKLIEPKKTDKHSTEEHIKIVEKKRVQKRKEIFETFGIVHDENGCKFLKDFLSKHSSTDSLGKFLFGEEFKLDEKRELKYLNEFSEFKEKYKYPSDSLEEYDKYVIASSFLHKNLESYTKEDLEYVYRMYALFPNKLSEVDQLI